MLKDHWNNIFGGKNLGTQYCRKLVLLLAAKIYPYVHVTRFRPEVWAKREK
jgi:hypothetical protein